MVNHRLLDIDDLDGLCALMAAGIELDGGLVDAAGPAMVETRMLSGPGACVVDDGGAIIGAVAIANRRRGVLPICGGVHPAHRNVGLGTALVAWALRVVGTRPAELWSESVTPSFEMIAKRAGFARVFCEHIMVCPPRLASKTELPAEVTVSRWSDVNPSLFWRAWQDAFSDRPGRPDWTAPQWHDAMATDPPIDAEGSLVLLANGEPIAFVLVDAHGIVQLGVVPAHRRRGIGQWLVEHSVGHLAATMGSSTMLCVNENNPGALALYESCGFAPAGQRGRWAKAPLA